MRRHPLLDETDRSLPPLLTSARVEAAGEWARVSRRTYQQAGQVGSGDAPFVDVLDLCWTGALTAANPIAAIVFLATESSLYWGKSSIVADTLPFVLSLHAYADYSPDRATFTANVGRAILPGVPVACAGDLSSTCVVHAHGFATAAVQHLARADGADLYAVCIDATDIKVGRKRIWHLREELASSLSPALLELFTRRRSGRLTC